MDNIYKAVQLTIDSQNLALSKTPTHVYIANQYVDTNDTPLITAPFIIQKALENGTGVVDIVSSTIGSIYEVRLLCDAEVLISGYFYMPPMNVNFSELELYTSYPPRTPPVVNEFWQKTENFILEKTNTLLNFVQVFNSLSSMRLSLGYLEELLTTKKSNLVSAINEVVSVKADKATTLVGYGISDAYTKSEIDTNYGGVKTLYDKNVEAGAGVNGWTATLVKDISGETQQEINNSIIRTVATSSDLTSVKKPYDGQVVNVKSLAKNFVYNSNLTATPNGITVVDKWEMQLQDAYYASWFCPKSSIDNVNEPQEDNINAGYRYATSKGRPFIIDKDYYVKSKKHEGSQAYPPISTENAGALWYAVRTLSNSVLAFQGGSKLKLQPSNEPFTAIIMTFDVENYVILEPHTIGDKDTHLVTTGEQGINMHFGASKNGYVRNPICENSWGDGMYFGFAFYCKPTIDVIVPTNLTIDNPRITNTSRNGISMCGGQSVYLNNTYIEKVDRTAPKSGIDIEPEEDITFTNKMFINDVVFNNTIIKDCLLGIASYIFGNRNVGVSFAGTTKTIGCYTQFVADNRKGIAQTWGELYQKGYVVIENLLVEDTRPAESNTYISFMGAMSDKSVPLSIKNMQIISDKAMLYLALPQSNTLTKATGLSVEKMTLSNPSTKIVLAYTDETAEAKPSINYNINIPDTVSVVYRGFGITFGDNCYIGGYDVLSGEWYLEDKKLINNVIFVPSANADDGGAIYSQVNMTNKGRLLNYSLKAGLSTAQIGFGLTIQGGTGGFRANSQTPRASMSLIDTGASSGVQIKNAYGSFTVT